MAVRDPQGMSGAGNGWSTHAITPLQSGTTYDGVTSALEPLYVGEFSPGLAAGVFFAQSPLTADPYTAQVPNLYVRSDLRAPGAGTYALVSGCPSCASSGRALPALQVLQGGVTANSMRPFWAGMSADGGHVAFESREPLTADAPISLTVVKLYEWDQGTVRLAGRVPPPGATSCDDVTQAPACVASDMSLAGQGAGGNYGLYRLVAHVVSDGSDGHTHVFFTRPTGPDGITLAPSQFAGQLFMRTDGTSTLQLNASERTTPDATTPATYLDASTDGRRVFFMTDQALTNDAPTNGAPKLYMYDATRPAGARLMFLSPDNEPADGSGGHVAGMIGASAYGHYAYFVAYSQLVGGQPFPAPNPGMYLWHDGTLRYIGPAPNAGQDELYSGGTDPVLTPRQSRVSPDGRHLLFVAESGVGLGGYDHGRCSASGGCAELYSYDADTGVIACASCNPSGAPATASATDQSRVLNGASQSGTHQNEALTDDGTRVFFTTAEALVPEDVNGKSDAYEWTANDTHGCVSANPITKGCIALLSTGTSPQDSWFMDASSTGDDAFFVTDQPLVGWDSDQAYDLYDARVSGGWPEPPPPPVDCAGEECRGALSAPPAVFNFGSGQQRPGNPLAHTVGVPAVKPKPRVKPRSCPKGKRVKLVHGKTICVKALRRHSHRPIHRGGK
jgi:hypothetical protein